MAETLTDAKGRSLELRKMTVLDQARMLRAIGPKQAENQPYVQLVECACMVSAIDGVPALMPTTEQTIDALLGRLGDDGIAAVMAKRMAEIQSIMEAAQAAMEKPDPLPASGS